MKLLIRKDLFKRENVLNNVFNLFYRHVISLNDKKNKDSLNKQPISFIFCCMTNICLYLQEKAVTKISKCFLNLYGK